eukprot:GILK01006827.1.p1 GENE.GILK01006827.1~~GILK01006827.1.p1  ORF type:complete len:709 (-),score=167.74 GILK01006827.1:139-2199(-)
MAPRRSTRLTTGMEETENMVIDSEKAVNSSAKKVQRKRKIASAEESSSESKLARHDSEDSVQPRRSSRRGKSVNASEEDQALRKKRGPLSDITIENTQADHDTPENRKKRSRQTSTEATLTLSNTEDLISHAEECIGRTPIKPDAETDQMTSPEASPPRHTAPMEMESESNKQNETAMQVMNNEVPSETANMDNTEMNAAHRKGVAFAVELSPPKATVKSVKPIRRFNREPRTNKPQAKAINTSSAIIVEPAKELIQMDDSSYAPPPCSSRPRVMNSPIQALPKSVSTVVTVDDGIDLRCLEPTSESIQDASTAAEPMQMAPTVQSVPNPVLSGTSSSKVPESRIPLLPSRKVATVPTVIPAAKPSITAIQAGEAVQTSHNGVAPAVAAVTCEPPIMTATQRTALEQVQSELEVCQQRTKTLEKEIRQLRSQNDELISQKYKMESELLQKQVQLDKKDSECITLRFDNDSMKRTVKELQERVMYLETQERDRHKQMDQTTHENRLYQRQPVNNTCNGTNNGNTTARIQLRSPSPAAATPVSTVVPLPTVLKSCKEEVEEEDEFEVDPMALEKIAELEKKTVLTASSPMDTRRATLAVVTQSSSGGLTHVKLQGLPSNCSESWIQSRCSKYGRIDRLKLNIDMFSGACKGDAYVLYRNSTEAATAVTGLMAEGIKAELTNASRCQFK